MTVILNGRDMSSREAAHDHLAKQLCLPAYYGRNLDALYDLLTEKGSGMLLVLEHSSEMTAALGSYGTRLLQTLLDAAKENPRLSVEIN